MNSSNRKYDDLTVITGIGEKTQQLLREHFDVRTYHDLANLSPAEIARLKNELLPPLRRYVDGWIDEAQERARRSPRRARELTDAETREKAYLSSEEGEWEFVGAFLVEFRVLKVNGEEKKRLITVERREINKKGSWLQDNRVNGPPSIEGEQLYKWMVEQLGEEVWGEPEERRSTRARSAKAPPATEPSVKVEGAQIRTFRPLQAKTSTRWVLGKRSKRSS